MRGAGAVALTVMGTVVLLVPMVSDHLYQRLLFDFYSRFGWGTNLTGGLQDNPCNPEYRLLYLGLGLVMIAVGTVLAFLGGGRST